MEEAEKQLLQKFLNGHCTAAEREHINILLNTPEGMQMLDELMREQEAPAWDTPPPPDAAMQAITARGQAAMQKRIADAARRIQPVRPAALRPARLLRHAAIWTGVLITAGITIWQIRKNTSQDTTTAQFIEKVNPQGVPVLYTLPDSSTVYLAAASTLRYKTTYPQTGRDIELQGEAFFDVKQNEAHPFIVHTGQVSTTVLGTSFKINAYKGQQQEVAVATGKVSVSALLNGKRITLGMLKRSAKLNYDPHTGKVIQSTINAHELEQWITGDLVIVDMKMSEVATELKRRYGATLVFTDTTIAGHIVSGTFSAGEPVMNILDMLGFVGKFKYTATGNTFNIDHL